MNSAGLGPTLWWGIQKGEGGEEEGEEGEGEGEGMEVDE
jgi:hypothetical protein